MKKLGVMLLSAAVVAALAGCGSSGDTASKAASKAASAAEEAISGAASAVEEAASGAASAAEEVVSEAAEAVSEAASAAEEAVSEVTSAAEEAVSEAASAAEEAVSEAASAAEDVVSEAEAAVVSAASEAEAAVESVASEAEEAASEAASAAESAVESAASEEEAAVVSAASEAESVVESAASEAESVVESAASEAESVVESAASEAESVVESAASEAESVAESTAAEEEVAVMSFEEFAAADVDAKVCVETYVQAKQAFVDGTASIYAQSEDGAYFIYAMACTEEEYNALAEGQKIKVTGYKAEWAGEVEIADATFEVLDGDTFVAEAEDVTELLGKDELINEMNKKVAFKGLELASSEDPDGNETTFLYNYDGSGQQGDDLYFNVRLDGQVYQFTVESALCDKDSDVYKAVEELVPGSTLDAEGFLYWYEGPNPHITAIEVTGNAAAAADEEAESVVSEAAAEESAAEEVASEAEEAASAAEEVASAAEEVVSEAEEAGNAVAAAATGLAAAAATAGKDAAAAVDSAVSDIKSEIGSKVDEAKEAVEGAKSELESKASDVKEQIEGILGGAEEAASEVSAAAEDVASQATEAAEGLASQAAEAAEDLASQATDAAEAVASEAEAAVSEAAETVASEAEAVASEAEAAASEAEAAVSEAAEAVDSAISEAEAAADEEVAVMTFEEFAAADVDTKVCVETYVQAKQAWVDGTASIYAQSEDGAYFIYALECTEDEYEALVEGQKIKVTGYKSEWAGEVEIIDAACELLDGDTYVAEAVDATELLGKDELANEMNKKVAFKGLELASSETPEGDATTFLYNYDGSGQQGDDLYFNVRLDGQEYQFTVESALCDKDSDVYKAVEDLVPGSIIDVEGFLYWYEGPNPHITSLEVVGHAEDAAVSEAEEAVSDAAEAVEKLASEAEAAESTSTASEA